MTVHADLIWYGINISSIAEDPLSIYTSKKGNTKEGGFYFLVEVWELSRQNDEK